VPVRRCQGLYVGTTTTDCQRRHTKQPFSRPISASAAAVLADNRDLYDVRVERSLATVPSEKLLGTRVMLSISAEEFGILVHLAASQCAHAQWISSVVG